MQSLYIMYGFGAYDVTTQIHAMTPWHTSVDLTGALNRPFLKFNNFWSMDAL